MLLTTKVLEVRHGRVYRLVRLTIPVCSPTLLGQPHQRVLPTCGGVVLVPFSGPNFFVYFLPPNDDSAAYGSGFDMQHFVIRQVVG